MSVTIRQAGPGDEHRVAEFAIRLFEQHVAYDPERFAMFANAEGAASYYRSRFDTGESAVMVADLDDAVVGFAYVELEERNYAELLENAVWLHDLFVDEAARHAGAGQKLLDACVEWAKHAGASKIVLHVAVKNIAGNEFFEKCGFRRTITEMTLGLS